MIEFLLVLLCLAIAAGLLIAWFHGNLFANVFLSLPVVALGAIGFGQQYGQLIAGCFVALAVIWLPRLLRTY